MAGRSVRQHLSAQDIHSGHKPVEVFLYAFTHKFLLRLRQGQIFPKFTVAEFYSFAPHYKEVRNSDLQCLSQTFQVIHIRFSLAALIVRNRHWGDIRFVSKSFFRKPLLEAIVF